MIARSFASVLLWLMTMGMIFYLLSLNWVLATIITPMLLYGTFAAFALMWMDEVDFGSGRFYRNQRTTSIEPQAQEKDAVDEEKRKRDRLDAVLRELSDEDLLRLRERLSTGDIDDDVLYERLVGEDGEFIQARKELR
jgi:hypothetical protein